MSPPMIEKDKFFALCKRFSGIPVTGDGPFGPPWPEGSFPTQDGLAALIHEGAAFLPIVYRESYVTPLLGHLDHLIRSHSNDAIVAVFAETLVGAVSQHAEGQKGKARPAVRQFLAVVSNYYRSFLSKAKRVACEIPQALEQLPPLATFRHKGERGPFTLPADQVRLLCGSRVGVVSLPAAYHNHQALWLALAHETGGHDVLHADPGLLAELALGVRTIFGGGPVAPGEPLNEAQLQALLWSYWIDEVASDVYAMMNAGPAFIINLAAFLAAFRGTMPPALLTGTIMGSPRRELDNHPTDILRLHVAAGAIESLVGLSLDARRRYLSMIESLAEWLSSGATDVGIQGSIEVSPDHWVAIGDPFQARSVSLPVMAAAARRVGSYIATARLRALGTRSIQEIETWDEADEATALDLIARNLLDRKPIRSLADDAQLLAGATLALIQDPDLYEEVNASLGEALAWSFDNDPVVGYANPHDMVKEIPGLPAVPEGTGAGSEGDPLASAPATGAAKVDPTPAKKPQGPAKGESASEKPAAPAAKAK